MISKSLYIKKTFLCRILTPAFLIFFSTSSVFAVELNNQKLELSSGKMLFTLVKTTPAGDSKMTGLANKFSGWMDLQKKTVEITMYVTHQSFQLSGEFKFANNRMHETYMHSDKYPTSKYSGTVVSFDPSSGKIKLIGNMSLHGVTKSNFPIECVYENTKKSDEYLLVCSFTVKLTDFNIEPPDIGLATVDNVVRLKTKFIMRVVK